MALSSDTALIFGRIVVAEDDRPIPLGGFFGPPDEALFIRIDAAAGEELSISLEDDGSFYVVVPPGTYLLAEIARKFDPKMAFRVPGSAAAYYLGTLRLDVSGRDAFISRDYVLTRVRLDDEFDTARQNLAGRFPDFTGSVEKSLMVQSDEFPAAAKARQELKQREQGRALLNTVGNILRALSIH